MKYNEILNKNMQKYATKITKNSEAAKDITQDVWQGAVRLDIYDERYLISAVKNRCIDYFRQKKYTENIELADKKYYDNNSNDFNLLIKALKKIKYGEYLYMYATGYKYKEIANIFNLNLSNLKRYIKIARNEIRKHFDSIEYLSML